MNSLFLSIAMLLPSQGPAPDPANELKSLQGAWEVRDAQASSGVTFVLPAKTGMSKKGDQITIRGNEVLSGGKVTATITLDFSATDLKPERDVSVRRRPLLLTLPDGTRILLAFRIDDGQIEMVHPHTIGNVGRGSFLYLGRPDKK